MKKVYLIVILLLSFFTVVYAQDDVSIKVSNLPAKIKSGDRFTVNVDISSTKPMSQRVWVEAKIPKNWQVISKKVPTSLVGLMAVRISYTVSIGKYADAGEQNVRVVVYKNGYEFNSHLFSTEVVPVRDLTITSLDAPSFVKEGDIIRNTFLIRNSGNILEKLHLKTSNGYLDIESDMVNLLPNSSLKVTVKQEIPKLGGQSWFTIVDLKATSSDSTLAPAYQAISIPVYNSKTKPVDNYSRFPLEVGLWRTIVNQQNGKVSAWQFDIRGEGFIDGKKKKYLEFILHGPDQNNLPINGGFAQYSASFVNDSTTRVTLGDYSLNFSRIIDFNRFGRGINLEYTKDSVSYSAFYQKPRFSLNIDNIFGGQYSFNISNRNRININYMSKQMAFASKNVWVNHIGAASKYKTRVLEMENESSINYVNDKIDFGFFNLTNIVYKRIRFSNVSIYAGKNYYGFFNNGWQLNNSIFYDISKKVTFSISNSYSRIYPSYDLLIINTSPFYQFASAEVAYKIDTYNRLSLNFTKQYREDRSQVKEYHFKEDFLRLMLMSQSKYVNFSGFVDGGYAHNLLISRDASQRKYFYRISAQNNFLLANGFTAGIFIDYIYTAKFSIDNTYRKYFYYGGLLRYKYKKYFDINLNYRNNYAPDELIVRRDFFNLQANLELGNHKLTAMGTQTYIPGFMEQNNFILSLQYRYLFNVAVAKVKNLGSIKGQITGSNVKKEGVLVQIGSQKYLTDTDGKFVINNLKPDRYAVNLFRSSMTMNDIPAHQGTLEVEVKADSIHTLEIPFIKAGMIAGKVNYEKGNNPGLAGDKIEKPTVLVKLFNGEDSHLTLANENGEFTFKEIKPGDWKLQATLMMGEGKFSISQPQRDVTVVAEQAKEVTFVVRPVSRTIRFIDRSIQTGSK